jgi:hypothetical protein
MPEWLTDTLFTGHEVAVEKLLARLALAFVLGGLVAVIYHGTRRRDAEESQNFVTTLVLLTILISVVTMVIGDNTARAFSLVGVLAIVRFRTVVADTRDTAFVVFAVVVGMAIGAGHPVVALGCLGVAGTAAALIRPRASAAGERWALNVRVAPGAMPEAPLQETFDKYLGEVRLVATATSRQGSALDLTYHIGFRPRTNATGFVAELNLVAGLQNIELRRL